MAESKYDQLRAFEGRVTPSRDRADIYDQQSAARARRYRERLKAKKAIKALAETTLAETVAADG